MPQFDTNLCIRIDDNVCLISWMAPLILDWMQLLMVRMGAPGFMLGAPRSVGG